jgi:hypothetical protein
MTDQGFHASYPALLRWARQTLRQHAPAVRPVNSFAFQRLPDFYDAETLAKAKAGVVDKVPVPPLSAMGLGQFAAFERMNMAGIDPWASEQTVYWCAGHISPNPDIWI